MGLDIQSHIEETEVATPVTFAHYLGTPQGTIYGYASSGWDNIMARTANEARDIGIDGLNFVGGHSFRGDGYSCAYFTGDTVVAVSEPLGVFTYEPLYGCLPKGYRRKPGAGLRSELCMERQLPLRMRGKSDGDYPCADGFGF